MRNNSHFGIANPYIPSMRITNPHEQKPCIDLELHKLISRFKCVANPFNPFNPLLKPFPSIREIRAIRG